MLLTEQRDGILRLTLDRPDKRNALNRALVDALRESFEIASGNDTLRAVVLSGNGDVFSAGADLSALQALQHATDQENMDDSRALALLFKSMYLCPVPIIGAINGHAIAGGCGLATLCDITIASDRARFGYTETRIGFVPALVTRFLLPKVGETQARRLLLSAQLISATEAQQIGLITESVPASEFTNRVEYWINVFKSEVSPQAVRLTRKLIRDVAEMSPEDALNHAATVNAEARGTADCKKGVAAFLNKSDIRWD